jgi:hypothetical protein
MLPNFLIIGAPRCSTTMLYENLKLHPDIFMSGLKEPLFFLLEGEKTPSPGPTPIPGIRNLPEYEALFHSSLGKKAMGEASTLYLYGPDAPSRIKHHIPHVKLIAILRQPVDRAYSHFMKNRLGGIEPIPDFLSALCAEESREKSGWFPFWFYCDIGRYADQISRFDKQFGQLQIRFFLWEDLQTNPSAVFRQIFQFLEVDETFRPPVSIRYNTAGKPKLKFLHDLLVRPHTIKKMLKPFLPIPLQASLFWKIMNFNLATPRLNPDVRKLLQDGYREDILRTQDLIQRDLSHWLREADTP